MIATDDPRHGSTRGYHAGCHEPCCRDAMSRREKYLKLLRHRGVPVSVPACGAQRRIQALMWAGWSATEIAHAAGWQHRNALHRILKGQNGKPTRWLERRTHDRVVAVFKDLWDQTPPSRYAGRTSAAARAKGYRSALAWLDIDDPNDEPADEYAPRFPKFVPTPVEPVDECVVERILTGDWRLRCSADEKRAVVARWRGDLNELERLVGWNVYPHVTRDPEVAA